MYWNYREKKLGPQAVSFVERFISECPLLGISLNYSKVAKVIVTLFYLTTSTHTVLPHYINTHCSTSLHQHTLFYLTTSTHTVLPHYINTHCSTPLHQHTLFYLTTSTHTVLPHYINTHCSTSLHQHTLFYLTTSTHTVLPHYITLKLPHLLQCVKHRTGISFTDCTHIFSCSKHVRVCTQLSGFPVDDGR